MPESVLNDRLDAAMVHALQLQPRASWSVIGGVLGVDASTVARRWKRLTDQGEAWLTGYPRDPGFCTALVEVECQPADAPAVAAALTPDPRVFSVEMTAGSRDLLVTVGAVDFTSLSRYALERFGSLVVVRATRTHPLGQVATEGSRWEIGALDPRAQAALRPSPSGSPDGPPVRWDEVDRRLALALADDGRRPLGALAETVGVSVGGVRRRLATLTAHGQLLFRCDVARQRWGWPVSAYLWLRTPPGQLRRSLRYLRQLRETRLCATTLSGPHDLVAALWLRSLGDLQRIETKMALDLPDLVVGDRSLVLGVSKLMGAVLDVEGRRRATVPLDVWSLDPLAAAI